MSVFEQFDKISNKLAISLHQDIKEKEFIRKVLDQVWRTTYDKHILFSSIAIELGYMQEETIRSAFLHMWCDLYENEREKIYNNIMLNFPNNV